MNIHLFLPISQSISPFVCFPIISSVFELRVRLWPYLIASYWLYVSGTCRLASVSCLDSALFPLLFPIHISGCFPSVFDTVGWATGRASGLYNNLTLTVPKVLLGTSGWLGLTWTNPRKSGGYRKIESGPVFCHWFLRPPQNCTFQLCGTFILTLCWPWSFVYRPQHHGVDWGDCSSLCLSVCLSVCLSISPFVCFSLHVISEARLRRD